MIILKYKYRLSSKLLEELRKVGSLSLSVIIGTITLIPGYSSAQITGAQGTGGGEFSGVSLPGIGSYTRAGEAGFAGGGLERKGLIIQPRINLKVTYTDNGTFSRDNRQSEIITEFAPGISILSNGSRVRGFLDYSLRSINYARSTGANNIQHALNTRFEIEVINNWAFLDLSGSSSRQTISAFGVQTIDTSRDNNNVADVVTYRLSPYIRGRINNLADYQLRYSESASFNNANNIASDVKLREWTGILQDDNIKRRFGWRLVASQRSINFTPGRTEENDRIQGLISYLAIPQLKLYILGGYEANNYLTLEKKGYTNSGYGFVWKPTQRTSIEAERDHRFFGTGYRIVFNHRTPRTAWRYSDVKDIFIGSAFSTAGSTGILFDVLFDQFASIEPDPVRRTQLVNNFLRANGLDGNTPTTTGFLPSAASLQRNQQLAFSLIGIREAITISANRTETQRLNALEPINDDLTNSSRIRQLGYGIQFAHTLSLGSTFNILFFSQTTGGSFSSQNSRLRTYAVNLNNQLGMRTVISVGARRTNYSSGIDSYNESAVFGQITVRF